MPITEVDILGHACSDYVGPTDDGQLTLDLSPSTSAVVVREDDGSFGIYPVGKLTYQGDGYYYPFRITARHSSSRAMVYRDGSGDQYPYDYTIAKTDHEGDSLFMVKVDPDTAVTKKAAFMYEVTSGGLLVEGTMYIYLRDLTFGPAS